MVEDREAVLVVVHSPSHLETCFFSTGPTRDNLISIHFSPPPPCEQKETKKQTYKDGLKAPVQEVRPQVFSFPKTPGKQTLGGPSQLESLGGVPGDAGEGHRPSLSWAMRHMGSLAQRAHAGLGR